jgi:hypothetical protein
MLDHPEEHSSAIKGTEQPVTDQAPDADGVGDKQPQSPTENPNLSKSAQKANKNAWKRIGKRLGAKKRLRAYPSAEQIEAYWVERKRYLKKLKKIPELRGRYFKALLVYMLRRLLWSFGFFPVFLSFWLPLVFARFNPVAMVSDMLPPLERFVNSNPEIQAATIETVFIAWLSVGFIFAVFDFVLTPFKSPYEYEADVHMRAWEELQSRQEIQKASETPPPG